LIYWNRLGRNGSGTIADADEILAAWLRNTFLMAFKKVLEGLVKNRAFGP
jgi:hypothetical protein